MNILQINSSDRKWYEIVLWWELRRIPYNIIMYFVGLASFYISYVSIPLVYLFIGFVFNLFYTFGWVIELLIEKDLRATNKLKFAARFFIAYLAASILIVVGIATIPFFL